jgi:hypothetical protein
MAGARRGAAAAALAATLLAAVSMAGPAEAESTPQDRLAANFEIMIIGSVKANKLIPEQDKRRTADCLAKALAADVPDAEAEKLSAIAEGRAKNDPALQKKWLTISQKEAPARNAQVMGRINKMCADIGPYVKGMM